MAAYFDFCSGPRKLLVLCIQNLDRYENCLLKLMDWSSCWPNNNGIMIFYVRCLFSSICSSTMSQKSSSINLISFLEHKAKWIRFRSSTGQIVINLMLNLKLMIAKQASLAVVVSKGLHSYRFLPLLYEANI